MSVNVAYMTNRGRPPGLLLNPVAARHVLDGRSQSWLAKRAEMSNAMASGLFAGTKGATPELADRIAVALGVDPGVVFPELVQFSTTVRHFTAPKVDEAA